jgi:hypothetical protein
MHDVISAFLDNEPFDGPELSSALATAEGRELLLDLIAMRSLVSPPDAIAGAPATVKRPTRWFLASAAAAVVTLVAGYQMGRVSQSHLPASGPGATAAVVAPEPTAVIQFEPGVNWTETPRAGGN